MSAVPGSGSSRARRLARLVVAILVAGLATFVAWLYFGGGVWRSEVSVMDAELHGTARLALFVASCHGDPVVTVLNEDDNQVRVRVVSSSTPFFGGDTCQDVVEVMLRNPLGDRAVIDLHSGQTVSVTRVDSSGN